MWQWVARGNTSTCRMGAGDNGCGSGLLGVTQVHVEWVEVIMGVGVAC